QSMVVTVDFRPPRVGDFSAVVPVTPCPTCSPRNISLSGRGVTRLLEMEPADIDFGAVLLGGSASRPIAIRNTSKAALTVQALAISGSRQFDATIDGIAWPATLAPGQSIAGLARFR